MLKFENSTAQMSCWRFLRSTSLCREPPGGLRACGMEGPGWPAWGRTQSRTEAVEGQYQGPQRLMLNLATRRGANTQGICFDLTKIQVVLECVLSKKFVAWSKRAGFTFFIHAALLQA